MRQIEYTVVIKPKKIHIMMSKTVIDLVQNDTIVIMITPIDIMPAQYSFR